MFNILVQNSHRCPNWSIDIHSKGNTLQREPKLVGEVYARQSQIHKTEVCCSSSFTVYFHFSIYKQGFYHILYFSPFPSRLGRTLRCRLPACSDFILPRKLSKLLDLSKLKINPNSIIDVCASSLLVLYLHFNQGTTTWQWTTWCPCHTAGRQEMGLTWWAVRNIATQVDINKDKQRQRQRQSRWRKT